MGRVMEKDPENGGMGCLKERSFKFLLELISYWYTRKTDIEEK